MNTEILSREWLHGSNATLTPKLYEDFVIETHLLVAFILGTYLHMLLLLT